MSIIIDHLKYIYMPKTPFERVALADINLEIKKGQFVAIIGHTGSGKSTLVQHLNGLLSPTAGSVAVEGVNIKEKSTAAQAARRKVGMVFQYPEHQLFEETIYADIAFGPRNFGLAEEEVERRVKNAMEFVNLDFETYKDRSPFQLSGGQMRRVAIAGVIALEPEYLVLDEPSAGLDPCGRDDLFKKILALYKKTQITVILVSHQMDDVARLANRVIVMNHGQIVADGTPKEVFQLAELLADAGVDTPELTRLMNLLSTRGLAVDTKILCLDEAIKNISMVLRGR